MTLKNSFFYLFLLLLGLQSCSSQSTTTVKLSVLDENRKGLPQSSIKLFNKDTSIQESTDLNGLLELRDIRKGVYTLDVQVTGYHTLSSYNIEIGNTVENIKVEMVPVLDTADVDVQWSGGWVTIMDEKNNIKSVRSKK